MFVFGKEYGASVCEISQNDFHKNITCHIILGKTEDITVIDKSGTKHTAPALLVKPMVEHSVVMSSSLACHIFLAPHSVLATSLGEFEGEGENGIVKLPPGSLPFHSGMSRNEIFDILDEMSAQTNAKIDPRLAAVIDVMNDASYHATIAEIVAQSDLSPSRLRVLAKEQIGVSLSTLLLWRKLVKSMKVLASGSTLSEAAQAGGFSDQAHFSRTMRNMFGITPSNSTYALNY